MYTLNLKLIDELTTKYRIRQDDIGKVWGIQQSQVAKIIKHDFTMLRWLQLSEFTMFSMGSFVVEPDEVATHVTRVLDWVRPTFHFNRLYSDYMNAVNRGVEESIITKRGLITLMTSNSEECLEELKIKMFLHLVDVAGGYMGIYISEPNGTFPAGNSEVIEVVPLRKYQELHEDYLRQMKVSENRQEAMNEQLELYQKRLKQSYVEVERHLEQAIEAENSSKRNLEKWNSSRADACATRNDLLTMIERQLNMLRAGLQDQQITADLYDRLAKYLNTTKQKYTKDEQP